MSDKQLASVSLLLTDSQCTYLVNTHSSMIYIVTSDYYQSFLKRIGGKSKGSVSANPKQRIKFDKGGTDFGSDG